MAKNIRKKLGVVRKKAGKAAAKNKKTLTAENNPLAKQKVAKTAKGRRELKKREAKIVENPKHTLVIRGGRTKEEMSQLLHDIHDMKKPLSTAFLRKHVDMVNPFESTDKLVQMCNKHDAALFCLGSSTKKRPHRLVFGRVFNEHLLDMVEFDISEFSSFIKGAQLPVLGAKPLIIFQGSCWDESLTWRNRKSLLMDVFRGANPERVSLLGLENVIVFTGVEDANNAAKKGTINSKNGSADGVQSTEGPTYKIVFRHYRVKMAKSADGGNKKLPYVSLTEIGPRFTMRIDREQEADPNVLKQAMKVPDGEKKKKIKNVETNALGQKLGRIHLGRQDFGKIYSVHIGKGKKAGAEDAKDAKNDPTESSKMDTDDS